MLSGGLGLLEVFSVFPLQSQCLAFPACLCHRKSPSPCICSSPFSKLLCVLLSARLMIRGQGWFLLLLVQHQSETEPVSWILGWVVLNVFSPACMVANLCFEPGRLGRVSFLLLTCISRSLVCVSSGFWTKSVTSTSFPSADHICFYSTP